MPSHIAPQIQNRRIMARHMSHDFVNQNATALLQVDKFVESIRVTLHLRFPISCVESPSPRQSEAKKGIPYLFKTPRVKMQSVWQLPTAYAPLKSQFTAAHHFKQPLTQAGNATTIEVSLDVHAIPTEVGQIGGIVAIIKEVI